MHWGIMICCFPGLVCLPFFYLPLSLPHSLSLLFALVISANHTKILIALSIRSLYLCHPSLIDGFWFKLVHRSTFGGIEYTELVPRVRRRVIMDPDPVISHAYVLVFGLCTLCGWSSSGGPSINLKIPSLELGMAWIAPVIPYLGIPLYFVWPPREEVVILPNSCVL